MNLLFLAAAMASSAVHSETITHREQPIDLHYNASVVISTQPKGVHAPLRGMERTCHWNAKLIIERRIGSAASPLRRLPVTKQVSGTAHGPCHADSSQVKRAADQALGDLSIALREAARHDSTLVLAEMEAAHPRATL